MTTELIRAAADRTDVRLDLDGRPNVVAVRVVNLSNVTDGYRVDAPTAPPWLQIEPANLHLLPGSDGVVEVTLSVPHPDRAPAHDTRVALRVQSIAHPHVVCSVPLTVSVPERTADVALTLEPAMLRGDRATSRLTAHNRQGNVPVHLQLRGSDPEGAVRFQFMPSALSLDPGQSSQAEVHLTAPQLRHSSPEQRRQLTITAFDGQRSFTASGTLVQAPPPPPPSFPVRPLLRVLFTLLGAALMLAGTFMPWVGPIPGSGLTVTSACIRLQDALNLDCGRIPAIPDALPSLLVSAGIVTVCLAVAAGLGLIGTGALTRLAGAAAVLYVLIVLFAFTLAGDGFVLSTGVSVVVAGGVMAVVGGMIARDRG